MRTKEEILDTIDGLCAALSDEENMRSRQDEGTHTYRATPKAAFVEAMKPFAEAVLDLRDLLAPLLVDGPESLKEVGAAWAGAKLAEANWRQDALALVLKALGDPSIFNLRKMAQSREREKADDADAGEEASPGHGRTDSDPQEAGPGA